MPFSQNGTFLAFFRCFRSICSDLKKNISQKPTCPLFFSTKYDKKIKEYKEFVQNKWAFDQRVKKEVFIMLLDTDEFIKRLREESYSIFNSRSLFKEVVVVDMKDVIYIIKEIQKEE